MSFLVWMAVLGTLLLILALAAAYLRWLPVTTSLVYLLFGLIIGPLGLGLWRENLASISGWFEHLTETAILISLLIGGLKLRLPFRNPAWWLAGVLAGPLLALTIVLCALFGHYVLGLPMITALLVAAILSPTDPVLASLVQVSGAHDEDRLRFGLSGEAGLNDGVAFAFVTGALSLFGESPTTFGDWLLGPILWSIGSALALGFVLGHQVGRLVIRLRARHADTAASANVFLGMALIALSYVGAELLQAWGFLATFAAGVGLRHAEIRSSGGSAIPAEEKAVFKTAPSDDGQPISIDYGDDAREHRQIAGGALIIELLSFGNLVERALEVLLVTILGAILYSHWSWQGVWIALFLFGLARPLSCALLLPGFRLDRQQRLLLGWFGIRGIGSLYYLSYASNHGLTAPLAEQTADLVITCLALSILLHGLTTQPLLDRYERRRQAA